MKIIIFRHVMPFGITFQRITVLNNKIYTMIFLEEWTITFLSFFEIPVHSVVTWKMTI
jgi:hypothetical protein